MKRKILKIILSFFITMICCTLIARGAASMTVAKVKTEGARKLEQIARVSLRPSRAIQEEQREANFNQSAWKGD